MEEAAEYKSLGFKTVFISHHGPSMQSVSDRFLGDDANDLYVNQFDYIFMEGKGPDLFVHGHVHTACDYTIGDTRVICNPRGYSFDHGIMEETGFNPILEVEIKNV